jgi:hypothetical protein
MVAKIMSGKYMRGALNYNEQKVLEGKAECIQANLFKREVHQLTFSEKLNRFQELNERNRRTKTNTLHISLNFDTTERLGIDILNGIATAYMDKIGFGNQPYLVYEHHDAAHLHIHILTTLIREDGQRIPIHYLGRNQSEIARKEIEKDFQLIEASGKPKTVELGIRPVDIEKVVYGKSESRRSISNVVRAVTRYYKYTSVSELNAVLALYNVRAERGNENSRMFERQGLLYSIVDDNGNCIGIPVKASAIYGKPTMTFLVKQFKLNEVLRHTHKTNLREVVDRAISSGIKDKSGLIKELSANGIIASFRSNAEGRTFGLTLIDTRRQVVFKGSDLGKAYSANAVLSRLSANEDTVNPFNPGVTLTPKPKEKDPAKSPDSFRVSETLKDIVTPEDPDKVSPEAALRLGRRRKRRKGRGL